MSLASGQAPSPLELALAGLIRSAVRNTNLVVDHALASGVPVLVPCGCAVDIGEERCVCGLGLPLPDRWMRAVRRRRAARRPVGLLPHRTCILCQAHDHDLAPTYEVAISAQKTAAGALPPEAVEAQKTAAGVR